MSLQEEAFAAVGSLRVAAECCDAASDGAISPQSKEYLKKWAATFRTRADALLAELAKVTLADPVVAT